MALFFRVFASLFLFLSQSVFAIGNSGEPTVWTYFDGGQGICSLSYSSFCVDSAYPSSTGNELISHMGCGYYGYSDPQAHYSIQWRSGWNDAPTGQLTYGNNGIAITKHITCDANQEFKLEGCTASCVTPEPVCTKRKNSHAIEKHSTQCGVVTCSTGVTEANAGGYTCTNAGVAHFIQSPQSDKAVFSGCELQPLAVPDSYTISDTRARSTSLGDSSIPVFCNLEYSYTGKEIDQPDTQSQDGELTWHVGFKPANADSSCDEGFTRGQKDGKYVCVPNSGKENKGCDTGEIRNNSGVCVPTSEAGKDKTNPDGSTTKTNSDGSTTTTSKSTTHNSNGSTTETTTKETTKPDGTKLKKTESVTKNPNGTTTKKTTNETTLPNGKKLTSESETTTNDSNTGTNNKNDSTTSTSSSGTNPDGSSFDNKANDSSSTQNADGTSSTGGDGGSCPNGGCTATTSGKCDTPPTCSGDPLVCASINQQWISTCKQTEALIKPTSDDLKKGQDGIASANAEYAAAQSSGDSKASSILSGFQNSVSSGSKSGSCIADISLSVMGKTMVIPFSVACGFFKFLRMIVIFMSYLAAMRIVYKGV